MPGRTEPLILERVSISPGRMRILVHVGKGAPSRTTPELTEKVKAAYPTITAHSCINSQGPTFGHVISRTSTPHLLEHIIIAEQVESDFEAMRSQDGANVHNVPTYVGNTQWIDPGRVAQIEVSFADDLVAVSALNKAHTFLNRLLEELPFG